MEVDATRNGVKGDVITLQTITYVVSKPNHKMPAVYGPKTFMKFVPIDFQVCCLKWGRKEGPPCPSVCEYVQ